MPGEERHESAELLGRANASKDAKTLWAVDSVNCKRNTSSRAALALQETYTIIERLRKYAPKMSAFSAPPRFGSDVPRS